MHHHHGDFDSAHGVARLEAEGERTRDLEAEAIAACAAALDRVRVERVLDLGCGPGLATVALARAFPEAGVVAVDTSAAMLERVQARALAAGLGARIGVRRFSLDDDLAPLDDCDLAWSSMAVHHARDPEAALARIAALLRPGGVLGLIEHATGDLAPGLAAAGLDVVADRVLHAGDLRRRLLVARR